jgi:hypothetical protein
MTKVGVSRLLMLAAVFIFFNLTGMPAQRGGVVTSHASPISSRLVSQKSFFPLEVGNEWVYSDGTDTFTVQVLSENREANGASYFGVSGYFPNDSVKIRKLRQDALGQILEFNPNGDDYLWYRVGNDLGAWTVQTGGNLECIAGSRASRGKVGEKVEVPAGVFERALRLDLLSPCADAGISAEYFAAGIGLVRRITVTIAGPRTANLVSAKVGLEQLPGTAYGVELSADHPVYFNNLMPPIVNPSPTMRARLLVRNDTDVPLNLTFPTTQRFDFVVSDATGKEITRWSDGRAFGPVVGHEQIVDGGRSYYADVVLKGRDGNPIPAGIYTLNGYLTTSRSESAPAIFSGTITFEIRDLH